MLPFRLAHAWPGNHWPHSESGEREFIAELTRHAGRRVTTYDRNDVTWLLTALRAGAQASTIVGTARGINPARLLAAYRDLEAQRAKAAAAWMAICDSATPKTLARRAAAASVLLPVPVARLQTAELTEGFAEICDFLATEVAHACELARRVAVDVEAHAALGAGSEGSRRAAQLEARRLWCASSGGLWNDPYFLPQRVGELTPMRANDLLGGDRAEGLT